MHRIEDIAELEALYGTPSDAALRKVAQRLTPAYRRWIAAARFCVISTVGPDGTDGTPRPGQYRSSTTRRESSLEASSST